MAPTHTAGHENLTHSPIAIRTLPHDLIREREELALAYEKQREERAKYINQAKWVFMFTDNPEVASELTKNLKQIMKKDMISTSSLPSTAQHSGFSHWQNTLNRLGPVPTKPIANAPQKVWHEVEQPSPSSSRWFSRSQYIYDADREIRAQDIKKSLGKLARRISITGRPIIILTGSHGRDMGENWIPQIGGAVGNNGIRDPRLIELDLYNEDVRNYGGRLRSLLLRLFLRDRIKIISMGDLNPQGINHMTGDEFKSYIESPNAHVIIGYCFGRNDEALRYFRDIKPVTSYV